MQSTSSKPQPACQSPALALAPGSALSTGVLPEAALAALSKAHLRRLCDWYGIPTLRAKDRERSHMATMLARRVRSAHVVIEWDLPNDQGLTRSPNTGEARASDQHPKT